jgi:nitrate/nitrite transporter NarK
MLFLKDSKMDQKVELSETGIEVKEKINFLGSFKVIFGKKSFNILLLFFCVYGMVTWLIYGWLPTFLKDHFHLNLGEAGLSATGYIQIGAFVGVILGGILADRWSEFNIRGRIYVVVIGFTFGAPFLFLMASTLVFVIAILAMLIFGIAKGFNDANLMPILCQIVDGRYLATSYGFLNCLSTIVGGLMVYFAGSLKDANIDLSIAYQVIAVVLMLACWSLLFLKLKKTVD